MLHRRPAKLMLISTGNLDNVEFQGLLIPLLRSIIQEFATNDFIEVGRSGIVVRG